MRESFSHIFGRRFDLSRREYDPIMVNRSSTKIIDARGTSSPKQQWETHDEPNDVGLSKEAILGTRKAAMAVRLRELCEAIKDMPSQLVAGRQGLDRPVRWVHMVENIEIASFLEGNEIAFTTGIGLSSQDELLPLVKSIDSVHASGVVINTGPYIHEIPSEVIRFCNERRLPMFNVPWSVHMAEIMHQFCLAITISDQHSIGLASALRNAILTPEREDLYLDYLQHSGFAKDWTYTVIVFALDRQGSNRVPDMTMGIVQRSIDNLIAFKDWRIAPLRMDDVLTLVCARYSDAETKAMTQEILDACMPILSYGEHLFAGIGKPTRSARCIGKSYAQAVRLALLDRERNDPNRVIAYSDMGMEKLLLSISDKEVLRDFYAGSIEPLALYDSMNGTDLVNVLKSYLDNNGSIQASARQLFVHRNTVMYKIRKIEGILDIDLSDFESRAYLSLGLQTYEMLHLSGEPQ